MRQSHPGPGEPGYRDFATKWRDAERYVEDEGIPWQVLVDDLEGTVHQAYGSMADPCYLIGTDGRVSLYVQWTFAPTLHRGIEALLGQGGRGVVLGGFDSRIHIFAPMVDGWRAIRRGLPQSAQDMSKAAPGSIALLRAGDRLRPLLAPVALRDRPLPVAAKAGLALGVLGLVALAARTRRK